ncbi:helix-turn-helix domain-containing protein [Acinetobacter guerrae]|uniref:helix-turn-helix domain-containing protein n=1 Tax=Acinetobacter guerrae TaxID=1843371 RepID=UPI00125F2387|nr:AraC family transcriptional regulator [Acinetobacter guerrae]
MKYQTLEQLQQHKTQLLETARLGSGMQIAAWKNQHDLVSVCSNHHTLSLYVKGGYESYRKTPHGWRNGGAPDRFCLMPQGLESTWDIRGDLSFVHLYYTDQHLRSLATKIWDREPAQIQLQEQSFVADTKISSLYRHFLLGCDWQEPSNHLQLSSTANLLLNHLLQHYSNVQWQLPRVTGGLAPYLLKHLKQWIEQHLDQAITLADLAAQTQLSEYHFAHMFKQSMRISPHQYVLQQRLHKAHTLILSSKNDLTDIALQCGFSSASHFSTRFKQYYGYRPSQLRQGRG